MYSGKYKSDLREVFFFFTFFFNPIKNAKHFSSSSMLNLFMYMEQIRNGSVFDGH